MLFRSQTPTGKPALLADPLVLDSGVLYTSKSGSLLRVKPAEQGAVERMFDKK